MDPSALLLAAAEGGHSETLFYVAGSLLAIFAVAVSVVGFARPDFPSSSGSARAVMGSGAVLVALAAFTSVYVAL